MSTDARLAKIKSVVNQRQEGIIVFEDIHDPHNAEAALRTADAFGFQKVYFIFEKEEKYNPRQIGKASSSSANKWLNVKTFSSMGDCLVDLKSQGFITYATVIDHQAKSIFKASFVKPKIAILFGNEHRGLSDKAIKNADYHIIIPMQGMVESLNLSVTAALCMYEVTRQRVSIGLDKFRLTKIEQENLMSEFLKR